MQDPIPTLDPSLAALQAELCRTMGHPGRLMIMYALRGGERCVSEIAGALALPQPAVSQHLAALRKVGMVAMRREGQHVYYELADPQIGTACDVIRGILQRRIQSRSDLFAG
jgi:DNA-binding transcriptional ArsR family regulator